MRFIKCINLDLNKGVSRKPIEVHQGETDSRYIKAFITLDDKPFNIPDTYIAKVDATLCGEEENLRVDEDVVCDINPTEGDTSVVMIPITGLMCIKGGKVELSLEFMENSSTVKTQKLYLTVIEDIAEGAEYADDVDPTARLGVNLKDKATGEVSTLFVADDKLFLGDEILLTSKTLEDLKKQLLSSLVDKITDVTLTAEGWQGDASPYYQVVPIKEVTPTSKVILDLTTEQAESFSQKKITFTVENTNGVVTFKITGDKPKNDHTFQITIREVVRV